MAAQKGISMVFKVSNSDSPETFSSVLSMQTDTMKINDEPVDVTAKDATERWTEKIRAGLRSMEYSGEGIFKDNASEELIRANVHDSSDAILNCQVVVPDYGTWEGPMIFTELEFSGEHEGAVMFKVSAESAGRIVFTAA